MRKESYQFLFASLLALCTLLIPLFFANNQTLSFFLLLGVSFLMLRIDPVRSQLLLFICVGVSGPLAEAIAIYSGLWTYASPVLLGVPVWLPLVWGNAGLYIIRMSSFLRSLGTGM